MSGKHGLLLRGMRWRLGVSVLTVLTTTIAVAAAVLGPLYLHTAGDSVVRRAVAQAPVDSSGITLASYHDESHPLPAALSAEALVRHDTGATSLTADAIVTTEAGVDVRGSRPITFKAELLQRTAICAHLQIVQGHCALGRGEAVLIAAAARRMRAALGSTVAAAGRGNTLALRVVGIAATPDRAAPYWWGDAAAYFPVGLDTVSASSTGNGPPPTDDLVVGRATVLAAGVRDIPTAEVQMPLRAGAVTLSDEGRVTTELSAATTALAHQQIRLSSDLPALLHQADSARHDMTTIIAIAATQLVVLAIWVLAGLLVRSSDARRSEARVARLRGFTGASMLWVTAAEPGLLCLVGAILGVGLAWLAILVVRGHLLLASATISFDLWTVAALALTLVVIVAALGIGAARLLRSADLAGAGSRRQSSGSAVSPIVDVVLVVLAVVALVALQTTGQLHGHSDPLASVAPGLIALGAAVIAVQVVLLACRLGVRRTAGSRSMARFLALRQTVRRPGVLRQARVLIIALCLACFATSAWSIARANRLGSARFQVGAGTVVTVAGRSATGLEADVDRADPGGRWAMAVAAVDSANTHLLAVQSGRLAQVVAWPGAVSAQTAATVARRLAPSSAPAVVVPEGQLGVTARVAATGALASQLNRADLAVWVFSPSGGTAVVSLGALRSGTAGYRTNLASLCPGGCRVEGVGVVPAAGSSGPSSGALTLALSHFTIGSGHPVDADLVTGGWRATATGVTVTGISAAGLALTVDAAAISAQAGATGAQTAPMVTVADRPAALPAVISRELATLNVGAAQGVQVEGLDGNPVSLRSVVSASALPRIGSDGAIVDLSSLAAAQTGPDFPDVTDEVWLSTGAPADALARLRAAGLAPRSVARASAVFSALQQSGPALADDFLLVATLAALLVAGASTLGALGATTRERATELSSLEVAGVPRRSLVRSLVLESVILVITALAGVIAGVVAAALAVSSLPELTSHSLVPLSYTLPAGAIAIVAVVVLGLVALAGAAVAAVLVRRMSPSLLRTAPDDISG